MIGFLSFWIFMLIDAIKHSKEQGVFWVFLVFFFWTIASFYYYLKVYRKRKETDTSSDYPVPE
jgi:uncharacterized protein (DUF486 family)